MPVNVYKRTLLPLLAWFILSAVSAQKGDDSLMISAGTGVAVSVGDMAPFWLISGRYGAIGNKPVNIWLSGGVAGKKVITESISVLGTVDLMARQSDEGRIILRQGYLGMKTGPLIVRGGVWESHYGTAGSSLSSGNLLWSGNALPLPRIGIETDGYITIPRTGGFAGFSGGLIHGWFLSDKYVDNAFLHHKYVSLRLGGRLPVHLEAAMHHYAQWGGISSDPGQGELPRSFADYLKVFFGKGGSSGVQWEEWANATGNHIGSYNLAVDADLGKTKAAFNWQTIFEDGSGMSLRNIRDGLWGLNFSFSSFNLISEICVEHFRSTDQSGALDEHYEGDSLVFDGGNDNYFNSWLYRSGWTYRGMTIGTPLITSPELFYQEDNFMLIANNRVRAWHLGLGGSAGKIQYRLLYTYSNNYGTYQHPFDEPRVQHSVLVEASLADLRMINCRLSAMLAFDTGSFLGNNFGCMISLKRIWQIR